MSHTRQNLFIDNIFVLTTMKRISISLLTMLLSMTVYSAPKPQRVLVAGNDPMLFTQVAGSDTAVGFATLLQPYFDEAVEVVLVESTAKATTPDEILAEAQKDDIMLLSPSFVPASDATETQGRAMVELYHKQLSDIRAAAKKKGVKIIWLTPSCPRYFTHDGVQVHRHGAFPDVVRHFATVEQQPLIDIESLMFERLTTLGQEASAALFLPVVPENAMSAEKAAREGNLLTQAGAEEVAAMLIEAIRADKNNLLFKRLK